MTQLGRAARSGWNPTNKLATWESHCLLELRSLLSLSPEHKSTAVPSFRLPERKTGVKCLVHLWARSDGVSRATLSTLFGESKICQDAGRNPAPRAHSGSLTFVYRVSLQEMGNRLKTDAEQLDTLRQRWGWKRALETQLGRSDSALWASAPGTWSPFSHHAGRGDTTAQGHGVLRFLTGLSFKDQNIKRATVCKSAWGRAQFTRSLYEVIDAIIYTVWSSGSCWVNLLTLSSFTWA